MVGIQAEKLDPSAAGARRVLIVDDYPNAAESFARYLRRFGHKVEIALGGLEGIAVAEKFRPDIVFLDTGMPHLDGYETASQIREQPWGKQMMLIALTGWAEEEHRDHCRYAGFDAQLVKPLAHSEISALLVAFGLPLSKS